MNLLVKFSFVSEICGSIPFPTPEKLGVALLVMSLEVSGVMAVPDCSTGAFACRTAFGGGRTLFLRYLLKSAEKLSKYVGCVLDAALVVTLGLGVGSFVHSGQLEEPGKLPIAAMSRRFDFPEIRKELVPCASNPETRAEPSACNPET